jgi:BrnA antitoxin of type II toxin-antitoxin system
MTSKEEAAWSTGVLVRGGGYAAVREALAERRKAGQRGPQIAPTKKLVSIRYSPEVIDYFKATGAGWQTRMDDALKQWVAKKSRSQRVIKSNDA